MGSCHSSLRFKLHFHRKKPTQALVPLGDLTTPKASTPPAVSTAPVAPVAPANDTTATTDNYITVIPPIADAKSSEDSSSDLDISNLREQCPRFRILIIGKANAGKTTILQKICNTTKAPMIHDQDGKVVDPSVIDPTDGRGIHDINHELTFSSNPALVFHDSPGFEAGSTNELEGAREFITNRAAVVQLKDRLHAIWYCLPTDGDRPLSDAEMRFFQYGTGRVPVIAIFSKYDGMVLKEYNKLRYDRKLTRAQARDLAPKNADDLFMNSEFYLKRLQSAAYPPARYLRVQNLHEPESNCIELAKQTLEALFSRKLQLLFVAIQQDNVGLATVFALKGYIIPALSESVVRTVPMLALEVISSYPHLRTYFNYIRQWSYNSIDGRVADVNQTRDNFASTMEPEISSLAGQGPHPLQMLRVSTAALIIGEDSFWLEKSGHSSQDAFKLALNNYKMSTRCSAVMEEIDEQFTGHSIKDLAKNSEAEFITIMQGIVKRCRA